MKKIFNKEWTLFLDRDGVINKKLPNDYVKNTSELVLCEGVIAAIVRLKAHFGRVLVVTNQQGIGKGLMTIADLQIVHQHINKAVAAYGKGGIDGFYFCPHLANERCNCRKPAIGMAQQAKKDFPSINFNRSVMIGDSESDMLFAEKTNMYSAFIKSGYKDVKNKKVNASIYLNSLSDFLTYL